MKRKLSALLLAALLLVSLSMTALAADTPTYGAYNVKAESGYTLTPDGTADGSFYANASAFTLSCPAGTSGEQTLVLLLAGESSVPTAENLQYIDQQASDGSISFTLKPKELTAGMTLLPGTIIATGTPAGVGMGFDPPKFLKPGDTVSCTIEGIGTLTNPVG